MSDESRIGRELRAARVAAGRTVASVAMDAGLSVPYIANLENGRGNPTVGALTRLAEALGMRLAVTLSPADARGTADAGGAAGSGGRRPAAPDAAPGIPTSLVRFARTSRFRESVAAMAAAGASAAGAPAAGAGRDTADFTVRLLGALAALAAVVGPDLGEADWSRLLDAALLVCAHPSG